MPLDEYFEPFGKVTDDLGISNKACIKRLEGMQRVSIFFCHIFLFCKGFIYSLRQFFNIFAF